MSIASIVTRGYGVGTVVGSISNVVLRGYEFGEAFETPDRTFSVIGLIDEDGETVEGLI